MRLNALCVTDDAQLQRVSPAPSALAWLLCRYYLALMFRRFRALGCVPGPHCACPKPTAPARASRKNTRNAKSLHATHSVSGIGAVSASCRCPQLRRRPPNYHRQRVARASSSARSLLADLLVMQWRLRNEIANSVENITAIEQSLLERKSSPPGTPTCIARRGFRVYH